MTSKTTKNKDVAATKAAEPAAIAQQPSLEAKRRPLKTFTIGDVHMSVWGREHMVRGENRTFFSLTSERSFRDRDGQYRYTRSLNPDDLGALVALCQKAEEYISSLQTAA